MTISKNGVAVGTFKTFLKAESRASDGADGAISYTGYGFKPAALIILATGTNQQSGSIGFGDAALSEMCLCIVIGGLVKVIKTDKIVSYNEQAGNVYEDAVLTTLDSDGFTLTWTKVGVPGAGTIDLVVLALG